MFLWLHLNLVKCQSQLNLFCLSSALGNAAVQQTQVTHFSASAVALFWCFDTCLLLEDKTVPGEKWDWCPSLFIVRPLIRSLHLLNTVYRPAACLVILISHHVVPAKSTSCRFGSICPPDILVMSLRQSSSSMAPVASDHTDLIYPADVIFMFGSCTRERGYFPKCLLLLFAGAQSQLWRMWRNLPKKTCKNPMSVPLLRLWGSTHSSFKFLWYWKLARRSPPVLQTKPEVDMFAVLCCLCGSF